MDTRAKSLADRIEQGVQHLAEFAEQLSQEEWDTYCPNEQRTIGVLIHHVASAYAVETGVIQDMAAGNAVEGVTWDMIDQGNAEHADANATVAKQETLELLRQNGLASAKVVRSLSDAQLDFAAKNSLHWDAPLTTQHMIEEHPVSHPYAHLLSIRKTLSKNGR